MRLLLHDCPTLLSAVSTAPSARVLCGILRYAGDEAHQAAQDRRTAERLMASTQFRIIPVAWRFYYGA